MERRFGHDFGKVRIHTSGEAGKSAKAVHAVAYTVGNHVAFAPGHYSPETQAGQWLLAHELAHVVQQAAASSGHTGGEISSKLEVGHAGSRAEHEASQIADSITSSKLGSAASSIAHVKRPILQRESADEWSEVYYQTQERKKDPKQRKVVSQAQIPYEQYLSGIGEFRATSKGGLRANEFGWEPRQKTSMAFAATQAGTLTRGRPAMGAGYQVQREISLGQLKKIYPLFAQDIDADKQKKAQAKRYLENLNRAFAIMKIDTVEAQSNYLAHAFVESDQFRRFTETQKPEQEWEDNPENVKVFRQSLKAPFKEGGEEADFIGRGPIQVTFRAGYVETIAMLEAASKQYRASAEEQTNHAQTQYQADKDQASFAAKLSRAAQASDNAALCEEAATRIRAKPSEAANPKYTFLFSAAFMKRSGADVKIQLEPDPAEWKGDKIAANWVAGGPLPTGSPQEKELPRKKKAYEDAYDELCENSDQCAEAKAKKAKAKAARAQEVKAKTVSTKP